MNTTLQTTDRADDRLGRMHAEYVGKVNALVAADREQLAHELAEDYRQECAGRDATAGPDASQRPAGRTRRTRESLRRFDRYTLDVFNPRPPYGGQHTFRSN